MSQVAGVPATPSGCRPSDGAKQVVSTADAASIPNAALLYDVTGLCKRGKGADRELDLRIYHAISPGLGVSWEAFSDGMVFEKNNWCHRYTASIDSALSILPQRALWAVADMEDGPVARICRPMPDGTYGGSYAEAYAENPARALCVAALHALAASAIEARSDATGTGAAEGESAVPKADAQDGSGLTKEGE